MKHLPLLLTTVILTSCATQNYVVDTKGVDLGQYATDLSECKDYRKQVPTGNGVAESAMVGLALGAIFGVILADPDVAREFATTSAIESGTAKAIENTHTQDDIVKNCLRNRGYSVLN